MGSMASQVTRYTRFEDRVPIGVLIVSPNMSLRERLTEKLTRPQWDVVEAGGGAQALKALREDDGVDRVLLLDPCLPDLDAVEFQGMVRDRFPNTQILMLNSQTGQLVLGSASPTPVSRKLA